MAIPFRFGGRLQHSSRDELGSIEVADDAGIRALYFGTSSRQSAMDLARPHRLELSYTRAMLCALLFIEPPPRILLIGLGGGSLAKFLWLHYPHCQIDVVEKRAAVAKIAHGWFGLPEDPRLRVHIADGDEFIRRHAMDDYALILVDAYSGHGMAHEIAQQQFYAACAARLTEHGVLATNLWGSDRRILQFGLDLLESNFSRPVLQLPVPGRGNVIGFGFRSAPSAAIQKTLKQRAKTLETELDIEFGAFIRHLRRSQTNWLEGFRRGAF